MSVPWDKPKRFLAAYVGTRLSTMARLIVTYHRRKADGMLASRFAFDDSDSFYGLEGVEGAANGKVDVINRRKVFSQLR